MFSNKKVEFLKISVADQRDLQYQVTRSQCHLQRTVESHRRSLTGQIVTRDLCPFVKASNLSLHLPVRFSDMPLTLISSINVDRWNVE